MRAPGPGFRPPRCRAPLHRRGATGPWWRPGSPPIRRSVRWRRTRRRTPPWRWLPPRAAEPGSDDLGRLGEVVGRGMALAPVDQGRFLTGADVLRLPAPGPEPAPGRRVGRARDVPGEHD